MPATPKLSQADRFKLMTYITEKYVSSGLTDGRFATLLNKESKLGLEVSGPLVTYYRKILEIPSNGVPLGSAETKLKELEDTYIGLADEVKDLKLLVAKMQESCRLAGVKMAP